MHHHRSYSPRSSFQFSTILPPLMLRPKIFRTLWKTWAVYGLPHSFEYPGWACGTMKYYLSNLQTWKKKNAFPAKPIFFKMPALPCISTSMQPLAAACSHLQPSIGFKWPLEQVGARCLWSKCMAATCSHLQPLEWPQAAAPADSKQVAAPDSSKRVPASGSKWPPQTVRRKSPQVAVQAVPSGWPQVAASARFQPNQFPPSKQPLWMFSYFSEISRCTIAPSDRCLQRKCPCDTSAGGSNSLVDTKRYQPFNLPRIGFELTVYTCLHTWVWNVVLLWKKRVFKLSLWTFSQSTKPSSPALKMNTNRHAILIRIASVTCLGIKRKRMKKEKFGTFWLLCRFKPWKQKSKVSQALRLWWCPQKAHWLIGSESVKMVVLNVAWAVNDVHDCKRWTCC